MNLQQKPYTEEAQKVVLSRDWEFGYERRMTYQLIYLCYAGYTGFNNLFGTHLSDYIFRVRKGNNSQYSWKSNDQKEFQKIQERLETEGPDFIESLVDFVTTTYKESNERISQFEEDFQEKTNEQIIEAYRLFRKEQETISVPIWILFSPFEHVLTRVLKDKLLTMVGEEEAVQVLDTISKPTEIIPFDYYLQNLYEIVNAPGDMRQEKLAHCTRLFRHMGMFDFHYEETTQKQHEERLKDITPEEAKRGLAELQDKYAQRKKEVEIIRQQFREQPYLTALIRFFTVYANYKEWKNFYREQLGYKGKAFFTEIAKRLNLSLEEAGFMTFEEISAALLAGKAVPQDLNKRIEDNAFIFIEDILYIVTDTTALSTLDTYLQQRIANEVKGTVAFPGVVRGKVKLVISSNDFHKVSQGDILVTSTTRPDYIKIMEKAGAFVTNEGGMLSHAAILAREMKKPCVIGTKVATKTFKDGDVVEVNADKGLVRILNPK